MKRKAADRTVTVSVDKTVTLKNNRGSNDKVLNITFDGISQVGDNERSQSVTKEISLEDITDALFGTWSGTANYRVSVANN